MISWLSKRDIKDLFIMKNFNYYGQLDEIEFLNRIINVYDSPSTDARFKNMHGDIIQHRYNNDDWEDDWIFYDERVNLQDDNNFREFIEQIFDPAVRNDEDNWQEVIEEINNILKHDNLCLASTEKYLGRSKYKLIEIKNIQQKIYSEEIKRKFSSSYINSQVDVMMDNIEKNPNVAIGKAKELIESCAKSILEEMEIDYSKTMDFMPLVKKVMKELGLSANNQNKNDEAGKIAAKILGNLSGISQSMSELRNTFGDGHGKSKAFKSLPPRYARLAVGVATTTVYFLWDTYQERKSEF